MSDDIPISTSIKIQNSGDTPTRVYVGFRVYSASDQIIQAPNYPYMSSKVLLIESANAGDSSVIVNRYQDWKVGCYLALNAEDDFSDTPNFSLLNGGKILQMRETEDGKGEITFTRPLTQAVKKGTKVRIHGPSSGNIYPINIVLNPGEEKVFSSTIKKDSNSVVFSKDAFPKGVEYVNPLVYSYSVDPAKNNSIIIKELTIDY